MTDTSETRSSGYTELIGEVLGRLAEAGSWLSAAERVDIAKLTRDRDATVDLRPEVAQAALQMTFDPTLINADWVQGLESSGLGRTTMVEILGVVSRQVAIDTFMFGVGADLTELPPPNGGDPTKTIVDAAKLEGGFLPTVGSASPRNAFTAVPEDQVALESLHSGLYLSMSEMAEIGIIRDGVSRSQMELVAARTSFLNECFF